MRNGRAFSCFLGQQRGGIAIIFGIVAVPLLVAAGIAVDYAAMSKHRASLQAVADSAAIAAAREIPLADVDAEQIRAMALSFIDANFRSPQRPVVATATDFPSSRVRVDLEWYWKPQFAQIFIEGVTPIRVSSSAQVVGTGTVCMVGLDKVKKETIHLTKSASLEASGCGVFSNSKHKDSIKVEDNAVMNAALTCSVGGVKGAKKASFNPDPVTDCPPIADPLADRLPPAVGACSYNDLEIEDEMRTLSPGTYCGGLKVKGTAQVKLLPGIYIIIDDKLEVTDKALFEGENVGFYLAGNKAKLSFKKETTINLTAPKDGEMAGLLIYEDRKAARIEKHEITSDNARLLLGTIYLPNGTLRIDSEAPVSDKAAYTAIIARAIELDEGPTLHLNSDYEATDVPIPKGLAGGQVRLIK